MFAGTRTASQAGYNLSANSASPSPPKAHCDPLAFAMLPDLQLNDLLRLRKPHPCGSYEWTVVRLGADIGLECRGCGHRVMLTRRELAKRMKMNLTRRDEQQQ